jgi:hypothetical protein
MKKLLLSLALAVLITLQAQATQPTQQQITVQLLVALGLINQANDTLINYSAPSTVLASFSEKTIVLIPANTTGNQVNLATTFPGISTVLVRTIRDVTNPPQSINFSPNITGTRDTLAGGGVNINITAVAPGSVYFDNPNSTASYIEIGVLGN